MLLPHYRIIPKFKVQCVLMDPYSAFEKDLPN